MITFFRFKNFRSFRDETLIDMSAISFKDLPSHLILAESKEIKKTLAIYGTNASGKTNLFLALASFQLFISGQIFSSYEIQEDYFMPFLRLCDRKKIVPFQSTEVNPAPTEMDLSFIIGQRVYEYGFTIINQEVLTEYLIVNHHVVYTRYDGELTAGFWLKKALNQRVCFRPQNRRLFCSVLSCLNDPEITSIMEPFKQFFFEGIIYYFDSFEPLQFLGNMAIEEKVQKIKKDPNALYFGLGQLRKLGIPVEDFIIEHGIPKLGYNMKSRATDLYQTCYMDFSKVSMGTIKYLSLFMKIYDLLQKGGVLLIDDISNELQLSVQKLIVDLFQQENNRNSQLIFTTRDSSLLNNQQFRKDEIAFVDINEYQESRIYTLADVMIQSEPSLLKEYLLEKYGSIPLIKDYITLQQYFPVDTA